MNERDDNGQQQQEQDMCEAWHEENRRLLNEFDKINLTAQTDSAKRIASPIGA